MKKISAIECLLEDAHRELAYIREYKREERLSRETGNRKRLCQMRSPSKQRIRENMKVIRRMTLEIEKGLEDE